MEGRETRASGPYAAIGFSAVTQLLQAPSSFPFDLTRAASSLAGGTLVSRLLASQRKRERGCDAQKPQNGSLAAMDPLFISIPSWASDKSPSPLAPPPSKELCKATLHASRFAISAEMGPVLHGGSCPGTTVRRSRLSACYFSASTNRTGNLTEYRAIDKPAEHGRAEGGSTPSANRRICRDVFRWLRGPNDVESPLAAKAKRQCMQHPLSSPCRPQSIRHGAEVLCSNLAMRLDFLGIFEFLGQIGNVAGRDFLSLSLGRELLLIMRSVKSMRKRKF